MANRTVIRSERFVAGAVVCTVLLWVFALANDRKAQASDADGDQFPIARRNLVLVSGTVFGKNELFILDTGTTKTILDRSKFLKRLGDEKETVTVGGLASLNQVPLFTAPPMILGKNTPLKTGDREFVGCFDLSPFRQGIGEDVAGMAGMDFLRSRTLRLDYDNGRATLTERAGDPTASGERITYLSSESPSIRVQVANDGFHTFMVDTGFTGGLTLERSLFSNLLRKKQIVLRARKTNVEISGEKEFRYGIISRVTIGSYQLNNLGVDEASANSVGLLILERFNSEFDFPNRKLLLRPSRYMNEPELRSLIGFNIKRVDGKTIIFGVEENAHNAGIRNDDVLVKINGKPAQAQSMLSIRRICMEPDTDVQLTLEREGKMLDVKCHLVRDPEPFPAEPVDNN